MSKQWYAANFCPREAECSLGEGALTPTNGPKIRTLKLLGSRPFPWGGTIQFFKNGSNEQDGFDPRAWLKCEGQTLSIMENNDLFALIGTMYGGDGRTTFCLPNLPGQTEGDYYLYNEYEIIR